MHRLAKSPMRSTCHSGPTRPTKFTTEIWFLRVVDHQDLVAGALRCAVAIEIHGADQLPFRADRPCRMSALHR